MILMKSSGFMIAIYWLLCVGRWSCLKQEGAAPINSKDKFLKVRQLMSCCPSAKSPCVNTIKKLWLFISRPIDFMHPFPRNSTELHAACTVNDRTSHRRTHDDQWTALHADFAPSSTWWTCWLSLNNWADFWSSHYLRVKFILRLMHSIHILKTCTEMSI